MIKPRLRLYVCASAVAVALGGNVLTQAAGPREFLSRLWNREPVTNKQQDESSSLNPFRWFRKSSDRAVVKVSDGGRSVTSERPDLVADPFLAEGGPNLNPPLSESSRRVIVRPRPSQRTYNQANRTPKGKTEARRVVANLERSTPAPRRSPRITTTPTRQVAASQPAQGSNFVDGFDGEFQKLVQEVVDESREKKETGPPNLPDDLGAMSGSPASVQLTEAPSEDSEDPKWESAELPDKNAQSTVSNLIKESRQALDASVLAGNASSQAGSPGIEFRPEMLPDQSPTDSELIVPSSVVPERSLFTTSDNWLNRGRADFQAAMKQTDDAKLQPIVRVVPGSRGRGVVIESGQWSPIRPRVSSNVAPARSVPDTSQFKRMSFEGAESSTDSETVLALANENQTNNLKPEKPDAAAEQASPLLPPMIVGASTTADETSSNDFPMMMIPDGRTGKSVEAISSVAEKPVAPAPPQTKPNAFQMDWPDESEIAPAPESSGFPWMAGAFFALIAGAASLFFRSNRQGRAFGVTGTPTETENS